MGSIGLAKLVSETRVAMAGYNYKWWGKHKWCKVAFMVRHFLRADSMTGVFELTVSTGNMNCVTKGVLRNIATWGTSELVQEVDSTEQ